MNYEQRCLTTPPFKFNIVVESASVVCQSQCQSASTIYEYQANNFISNLDIVEMQLFVFEKHTNTQFQSL